MEYDLHRVVDALPGLVWTARPDGRVEFLNQRWRDYTGRERTSPFALEWQATIHPEDLPLFVAHWRSAPAPTQPWENELRLRRADGAYRWFLCRSSPLLDTAGSIDGWCGINTDIDDRRRAEIDLHAIEINHSEFVRSFPGLIVTMDTSGRVDLFSEEVLAYFGKSREELRSWSTMDAVHPDDLSRVADAFAESVSTGKPYLIEHRCRRFDGAYRWFQVRAHAVREDRGDITGWYVVLTDIHELKRAEEAMRATERKLTHVARVTTVSALTASIAHEVNQPLSGIITNASTCLRMLDASTPNVDGARETARRILRDGNRASDVISRLRALFSKKEFALESLDLNEATQEVIALSASDLLRHNVVLQLDLADDLPTVTGDRVQLQQVVLNLLRNALDAMVEVHDRPRRMVIRTEREGSDRVRVTVCDAGVGVDRESIEKLFDTFYTTKSDGMGVGLSVSRSIIESHRGRIWAAPNEDSGTTFAFSIPAWSTHERAAAP
jgi:PAS domain S-box-containing protein